MTPWSPSPNQPVLKATVDVDHIEDELMVQFEYFASYYGHPRKALVSCDDFYESFIVAKIICEPRQYVPSGNVWVLG